MAVCFNPRPRAGGDAVCKIYRRGSAFQSTPPCGGRPKANTPRIILRRFQSTPPCGGRPRTLSPFFEEVEFQSTPPCGGRQGGPLGGTGRQRFNPRPRAGGDVQDLLDVIPLDLVSIHAPVRGATGMPVKFIDRSGVSIHAPVRGATLALYRRFSRRWSFNPRPRAGGDKVVSPRSRSA